MTAERKATRSQVLAVAAKFGIRVHDDGEKIAVDLPRYAVLRSTGLHHTDVYYEAGNVPKPIAWAWVLQDIEDGTEKCADPECDCCTDDEGWAWWEERRAQEDADVDAD